ncbi:MAG: hypothetical protein K6E13_09615 [Lachnospiraceae bacterium]|nr:hypothetical protein [Lachnospiraceae bacterium]
MKRVLFGKPKIILSVFIFIFSLAFVSNMDTNAVTAGYAVYIDDFLFSDSNLTADSSNCSNITSGSAVFDPDSYTLTLTNFTYSGTNQNTSVIKTTSDNDLTIELVGTNTINASPNTDEVYGIASLSESAYLSITGTGSLNITCQEASDYSIGISCNATLYIADTTISIESKGSTGSSNSMAIKTANMILSDNTVLTAIGGDSPSSSCAILVNDEFTMSDTTLNVTSGSSDYITAGIIAKYFDISSGNLTAKALSSNMSAGIILMKNVESDSPYLHIAQEVDSFVSNGYTCAVMGTIINDILGTGWTNVTGTSGVATIDISSEGHNLSNYKKMQFPIQTITASAANYSGTYDGNSHSISVKVTKPSSGATITYGKSNGQYTLSSAPTYTSAGSYTIYYKVSANGYEPYTGSAKIKISQKPLSKITFYKSTFAYTGKVIKPSIKTICGKKLKEGTDYTVKYKTSSSKNPGSYTVIATGKGNYRGSTKAYYKITVAKNPVSIKAKSVTLTASNLKRSNKTLKVKKCFTIKNKKTTLTFKIKSVSPSSAKKRFSINKGKGTITVKKGLAKGTYKLKIKVDAQKTKYYKKTSLTRNVTIKVI